jgi:hypothetical protein
MRAMPRWRSSTTMPPTPSIPILSGAPPPPGSSLSHPAVTEACSPLAASSCGQYGQRGVRASATPIRGPIALGYLSTPPSLIPCPLQMSLPVCRTRNHWLLGVMANMANEVLGPPYTTFLWATLVLHLSSCVILRHLYRSAGRVALSLQKTVKFTRVPSQAI